MKISATDLKKNFLKDLQEVLNSKQLTYEYGIYKLCEVQNNYLRFINSTFTKLQKESIVNWVTLEATKFRNLLSNQKK